jgi:hypothetical protein
MWTKTILTQPAESAINRSNRRRFLKNASLLAPVLMIRPSYLSSNADRLRIGLIGAGAWGQQYLSLARQHSHIDVRAICDTNATNLQKPTTYSAYKDLLQRTDIDAVIIATPWQQHYPIAKAALLAGKHVACGPVMGATVEEHLDIVAVSKQTGKHYFTLDEHSYRPDLMAVSQMVDNGIFGDIETIYAGACYQSLPGATAPSVYPVYPALATANMIGLQNNRYVSVQALQQQQEYITSQPHPKTGAHYLKVAQGAVNTICITTGRQQAIYMQSSTNGFSTGFKIKGSTAHWLDFSRSIYIDNNWQADQAILQQYQHPLCQTGMTHYKQPPAQINKALALHDFVQVVQQPANGWLPVHTAAANSLIGPLAQLSAQRGGAVIAFPNFV